ncbi:MAG: LamG-like jellyroll fold domain-containing protein [Cyclobacteriaceae bacterium]
MTRKLFTTLLQISAILFIVTNVYSQSSSHSGTFYRIPTNSNLEISGDITMEAWVRPNSGNGNLYNIAMKGNYGYGFGILSNGRVMFWKTGSQAAGPTSTGTIPQDGSTWTHVAVSIDRGTLATFYINGVSAGTASTTNATYQVMSGDLSIGTQGGCNCNSFNGLIDEVRIWNDVRTAGEISANYNQAVSGSEQGLAAYYRFNEGSGTTIYDEKTATAYTPSQNSITWSATDAGVSDLNYALDFTGGLKTVQIGDIGSLSNWTLETWFKVIPAGNSNIFQTNFTNNADALRVELSNNGTTGTIAFPISDGVGGNFISTSLGNNLSTAEWRHVAIVGDVTNDIFKVYLDGTEVINQNNTIWPTTFNVRIGIGFNSTRWFTGQLDEFRVWSDVRSETEIQNNLYSTLLGNEAGLHAYYPFDEGSGTTAFDQSTNSFDGVIAGGATYVVSTIPEDTTPPTISITGPASSTTDSPFQITLTASEAINNLEVTDLAVTNGTASNLATSDNITWTADITPTAGGSVTVDLGTGIFTDYTGNANTAAASQYAVTYELPNYALDFDGVNDYISIPDDLSLSPTSALTIEAWIYLDAIANVPVVHKWGSGGAQYSLEVHSGKLVMVVNSPQGGGNSTSSASLSTGNWIHVAGIYDGQVISTYINGTLDGQTDLGTIKTITSGTTPVAIGRRSDGASGFWNGRIDEVRIWSSGRTVSEILNNKDTELTGTESGLVAYYNFNQSTGTALSDLTTNNNDGTLNGFALSGTTSNWVTTGPTLGAAQADVTPPTPTITTTSATTDSPITIDIDFGENVINFDASDLSVTNAIIGNFVNVDGQNYTADIYPIANGAVTVDIASSAANDLTGNPSNAATQFTITADLPSGMLNFDGFNDFVDISGVNKLTHNPTSEDYTIEMWFSADALTDFSSLITYSRSTGNEPYLSLQLNSGAVRFFRRNNTSGEQMILTSSPVNIGEWYHVAVTKSGDSFSLYLNGSLVDSGTQTSTGGFDRTRVTLGAISAADTGNRQIKSFYDGSIDEVKIWNDARTSGEIAMDMYEKYPSISDNLEVYYPIDHNGGELLVDQGPNEINGELFGEFGVVASSTNNTVTAKTPNASEGSWLSTLTTDETAGSTLKLLDDLSGVIENRIIISNTASSFTVSEDWTSNPAANGPFAISYNNPVFGTSEAPFLFAPTVYNATAVSASSFTANWDAQASATAVYIDVDDNSDFSSPIITDQAATSATGASHVVSTALTAGTVYYYRVSYNNGTLISQESDPVSFMVEPGNALDFTAASSQYVNIPTSTSIQNLTTYTFSAWVYLDAVVSFNPIFMKQSGSASDIEIYGGNAGYSIVHNRSNGGTFGNVNDNDPGIAGQWHHLAVAYDGTNLSIYINGELDNTGALASPLTNAYPIDLMRATSYGNHFTSGMLDEVRLWDHARTQGDIQADLYSTLTGSETGLVAYYRFDVTSGTTLPDLAGNNDGTLTNMAGTEWTASGALQLPPPSAPTNLIAYATAATDIAFEWTDNATNETGFKLESADDYAFTTNVTTVDAAIAADATTVTKTIGTDIGKFYRLTATNGFENASSQSSVEFATTKAFSGSAMSFDGNDYVVTQDITISGAYTIEMWFKTTVKNVYMAVISPSANTGNNFNLLATSTTGQVRFVHRVPPGIAGGVELRSTEIYTDGNWHHVAGVFDGVNTAKLYVDGVEVAQNTSAASNPGYLLKMSLGKNFPSASGIYTGGLDEVRIWDNAKTEFSDRFASLQGDESGLLLYYPFDENTGTTVIDRSANTINATITGATFVASDFTAPTPTITSTESGTTTLAPFPVTITFSESVADFVLSDISVTNGTAANLGGSGLTYTADIYPTADGQVDVDIAAGVATAGSANGNTAATTFNINATLPENAASFDGAGDYISLTRTQLAVGTSFEAWIKTASTDNASIYAGGGNGITIIGDIHGGKGLSFGITGGLLQFHHYNGSWNTVSGSTIINDDSWHHVAATHNAATGEVILYVDGQVDGNGSISYLDNYHYYNAIAASYVSPGPTAGDFFDGLLDEVRIWGDVRTAQEIVDNTITVSPAGDNLIGQYSFNQTGGILQDQAGSNNGILIDGVLFTSSTALTTDVSGPTVAITSSESGTTTLAPFPVTITFSESVADFVLGDITVTNGSAANLAGSGTTYTADIYPAADGQVDVDVAAGVATDGSANGNTATTTFSITATVPENALDFDGVDDHVRVSNQGDIQILGAGSFTAEAWFKGTGSIVTKGQGGASGNITNTGFRMTTAEIGLGQNGGASDFDYTIPAFNTSVWNHMSLVRDATNDEIILYINGSEVMRDAYSGAHDITSTNSNSFLTIGATIKPVSDFGIDGYFNGEIDNVRIWNVARSEDEILGSLTDQIASAPGLVASYDFNHSSGTSLVDLSGSGNTGTLTNFNFGGTASDWVASTTPECAPLGQFIGAVDADWNDPSNWCGGVVPTANNVAEDIVVSTNSDIVETQPLILNANKFQVKEGASLTLNLTNNDIDLQNAATFTNNGTVNVTNGTNVNASSGVFTNNGTVNVQTGTGVNATTGSFVNKGTFFFESGAVLAAPSGTFINEGRLKGFATVNNNFENPALGTVAPGASPGCMTFQADFTNVGLLEVDINGTTACTEYDQITVGGTANLDGTLTVILGTVPVHADSYVIIDANAISGTFTTVNLPDANWNIQYNFPSTGQVSLTYFDPNASFALDFDGINDHIRAGNDASLQFERTDAFTIETWIKTTFASGQMIAGNMIQGGTYQGYGVLMGAGGVDGIYFTLVSTAGTNDLEVYGGGNLYDDSWHHIALTYDGSSVASGVSLYVDGVAQILTVNKDNLTGSIVNTNQFRIGARDNLTSTALGSPFLGQMDEVRVWNTERTSAQINAFKDSELNGGEPNLVGYWNFSDGPGDNLLPDVSGNGNDGTLTNMDNATDYVLSTHNVGAPGALDATAPTVAITGPGIATGNFSITIDFSEDVTNFDITDLTIFNGTALNFHTVSASQYTVDIIPLEEAPTTIDIAISTFEDLTGNANTAAATQASITVDLTAPGFTTLTYSNLTETSLDIDYTLSESGTVYYLVVNAGDTPPTLAEIIAPGGYAGGTNRASGTQGPATSGTINITGLTAGSDLEFYFASEDANGSQAASHGSMLFEESAQSFVQVIGTTPLQGLESGFTIESWVKPDFTAGTNTGYVGLFGQQPSGTRAWIYADGRVFMRNSVSSDIMSSATSTFPNDGDWHHVALVNTGISSSIYIDGVSVSLVANTAPVSLGADDFYIGTRPAEAPAFNFDGYIDEMRIWNVARSQTEIANNMNDNLVAIQPNLVASWNFNDGAGTYLRDVSGSGFPGLLTNTTDANWSIEPGITVSTPINYALDFDGLNEYVTTPPYDFSAGSTMTIEAWVKPVNITTNTHYQIIRQDDGTNLDWLLSFQSNGTFLSFGLTAGGSYEELDVAITAASYTDGNWHHIAAVYDGINKYLYSDGVLIGTQAKTGNVAAASTNATIASSRGTSEWFNGQMDEVRLWSTARSLDQILAFKGEALNGTEPGLDGYYDFQEGPGNIQLNDINDNPIGFLSNMNSPEDFAVATLALADARTLDETAPTPTISTSSTTTDSPITIDIDFGEVVVNFEETDLSVSNAIVNNFVNVDGQNYTADLYANSVGIVTVDIAANVANDLTGNTSLAATQFSIAADLPNNALDFNGIDQFVDISDIKMINEATDDYTYSFWFKADAITASLQAIFGYGTGSHSNEAYNNIHVSGTTGVLTFEKRNDAAASVVRLNGPVVTPGKWYHVAITKSTADYRLYVNGVQYTNSLGADISGTYAFRSRAYIGAFHNTNSYNKIEIFFDGSVDELKIWNDARSPSEVAQDMYQKYPTVADNLEAYYSFDQTAGDQLIDLGPNSFNGLILGTYSTATAPSTSTVLTNSTASYGIDALVGSTIKILDGKQTIETRTVVSNTATSITVDASFTNIVAAAPYALTFGQPTFATTGAQAPVAYQATDASINGFTANWSAVPSAQSLTVDIATDQAFTTAVATDLAVSNPTGSSFFVAQDLSAYTGQKLYYRLRFTDGSFTSPYSEPVSFMVTPGNALDFTGTQNVTVPSPNGLPIGADAFTIEAWINPTIHSHTNGIIGWGSLAYSEYNGLRLSAGETYTFGLIHYFFGNDLAVPTGDLSGAWHHVAVTYDGTTRAIYLDGALLGSDNPATPNVSNSSLTFGRAAAESFTGEMDELRVWNRALTPTEITSKIFETLDGNEPNLVSYYRFDETTGTLLPDLAGSNDGTLTNMAGTEWTASGALTVPAPNVFNATQVTNTGVVVDYTAPSGADNILIDIATTSDFSSGIVVSDQSAGTVGSATINATLADNTVYYYRAKAIIGTAESASVVSNPFMVTPGNAISFVGGADQVVLPLDESMDFTDGASFTFDFWFKTNLSSGTHRLLYRSDGSHAIEVRQSDNFLIAYIDDGQDDTRALLTPISTGVWTHTAVVFDDGGDWSMYLNGDLVGNADATSLGGFDGGGLGPGPSVVLGSDTFDGAIDELRVWSVPKSASEIKANLFKEIVGNDADLVAYYKFDQTTGTALNDYGAGGNSGVLENMNDTHWVASGAFAPTLLQASEISVNGFVANWFPLSTASQVLIDWDTDTDFSDATNTDIAVSDPTAGSFFVSTDLSGLIGQTLYYRLKIENNGVFSQYSEPVSFMVTPGNALVLDGIDDRIDLGATLISTSSNAPLTLEAWVNTADKRAGAKALFAQYGDGLSANRFSLYFDSDDLHYWKGGGGEIIMSVTNVNDGNWHHVP